MYLWCFFLFFFFFSSRRRHTRCLSDWSSDVCSSDLSFFRPLLPLLHPTEKTAEQVTGAPVRCASSPRRRPPTRERSPRGKRSSRSSSPKRTSDSGPRKREASPAAGSSLAV